MSNQLYLECYYGISGDMAVAALLDLGADQETLERVLKSLPVTGFRTEVKRVEKAGLAACDFSVLLDKEYENHDHDMEFLHGHEHSHEHGHEHGHEEHSHEDHTQRHHTHGEHTHRGLSEIRAIISQADMTARAKHTAGRIFEILGAAEGKAHGVSAEEVHFHEVGAVDSIVDIISFAVCLDNLNIEKVFVPVLYEGSGTIRCAHGVLPVPVPAVSHIAADHGLKLHITETLGEFVTPTGAAIAAAVKTDDRLPEQFAIKRIGLGAGKRSYERPSLLRAMLLEPDTEEERDVICKLESNIDDCSGEALGFVMEELLLAGARDVHYTPVFMKKNRPAYQLTVICEEGDVPRLEQMIFHHTTTIGIRRQKMERSILKRERKSVETSLGTADIKVCKLAGESRIYPEYESIARLSRESGRSFSETYRIVERESHGNCE